MVIHFGYLAKIFNVDFEEEIYVECPQGMIDMGKDDCIILNKCIYSLIQAEWQYHKKAVKILKKSGFMRGNLDPASMLRRVRRE